MAILTVRGQNFKVLMSRTSSGTKVEIDGGRIAMRQLSFSRTRDTRTAPGGGSLGKFYLTAFALGCDSNARHDPLFENGGGQRFWCTARPLGKATPGAKDPLTNIDFQAVCGQLSMVASQSDDSCVWSVNLTVDGDFDPFQ